MTPRKADHHDAAPPPAPATARVLVVDDDPITAESLAEFLASKGHDVATASSGREALELILHAATEHRSDAASGAFQVVITDDAMPGLSGQQLIDRLAREHPAIVPIVLTGYGSIESAVQAVRRGAFEYLVKPAVDEELMLVLERAIRQQVLLAENRRLRDRLDTSLGLAAVVGKDHRMVKAMDLITAVAPTKATVLMTGESGTGKSMFARAVHQGSPRKEGPFVELHCGSIPETLLESELFGHVKGAFTGAHADKQGRFLAADGGTIFLDEINSASPGMQLKLLRVLQERCFEPVGSTTTVEVDVRVVLASNQPLEDLVREGRFRQDLYYRINVVNIELPPLRDRPGDIPLLVEHLLRRFGVEHGKQVVQVDDDALALLQRYSYPGNVRELGNIIERAVVLARRPTIGVADLPPAVTGESAPPLAIHGRTPAHDDDDATPWTPMPLAEALEVPERRILLKALRANEWNRQKTADELAINRTTLYKKMKRYGLDRLAG